MSSFLYFSNKFDFEVVFEKNSRFYKILKICYSLSLLFRLLAIKVVRFISF